MSTPADTQARSKEHHVAVGLQFWSAFSNGDIETCVELLHPGVEWHPTPRLDELDVVRGQDDVHITLQVLYDRFADDLEVRPEDGRQVGDHVLMVTMLTGRNQFTKQPISSRECWVVSIRDDKLGRIVVYPNAPAARLGFEEILKASGPEIYPSVDDLPPVTLAPEMEDSSAPPAELANVDLADNGLTPAAHSGAASQIPLTFSFEEAEALNRWMLKPAQD